ncbi:hypothetical protein TrVE_jg2005 [Triparma verrucosa]|uniref:EF-hand domain-containing protein n=2 Tax=Triparma TaxID=722752 RepID=A0A9W7EQK7_9STRA|nr:hypothetical protein TrVE_jg2005 [Triparma verrucosa]GMH87933.1 hypothetical protein TrST_g5105 [Triparma strigata]
MLSSLFRSGSLNRLSSSGARYSSTESARKTIIIGAAGAVGKRLCKAITDTGQRVIASDRMENLPGSLKRTMGELGTCVGNVDVTDQEALRRLFQEYGDENTTVWNLAAPLSVETALDPAVAEAVTIGGMEKVLTAMSEVGARRICFTDSIGSFGSSSPRTNTTARWLTENPTQDPGSDYGRQKRGCRELMSSFASQHSGDPRFAVLPGVLHCNSVWGNGTTEYALDALLCAPHQATRLGLPTGDAYVCPIDPDVRMPMVFVDDLMRGLVALQEAEEEDLKEPERGYCIPGLSFTPNELFTEIRKHHPGFGFRVELDSNMNKFANLWPDELSPTEASRDLGYVAEIGLKEMVEKVLTAHEERNVATAEAFKSMDVESDGVLDRLEIEYYVRRYLVRGRESYGVTGQNAVTAIVDKLMEDLDTNLDGIVSWQTFSEWNRSNTLEGVVLMVKNSFDTPEFKVNKEM